MMKIVSWTTAATALIIACVIGYATGIATALLNLSYVSSTFTILIVSLLLVLLLAKVLEVWGTNET